MNGVSVDGMLLLKHFKIGSSVIFRKYIRVRGILIYTCIIIVSLPMLRKGSQIFDGINNTLSQASKFDAKNFSSLGIVICVCTYSVVVSFSNKLEEPRSKAARTLRIKIVLHLFSRDKLSQVWKFLCNDIRNLTIRVMPRCDEKALPSCLGPLRSTDVGKGYIADVGPDESPGGWEAVFMPAKYHVSDAFVRGVERVQ